MHCLVDSISASGHSLLLSVVISTDVFNKWLAGLRDRDGRNRIMGRLERLRTGHVGDARPVGEGVSELRVHAGPGYRVYFVARGQVRVVVLAGGDKSSQERDIVEAKALAKHWR